MKINLLLATLIPLTYNHADDFSKTIESILCRVPCLLNSASMSQKDQVWRYY